MPLIGIATDRLQQLVARQMTHDELTEALRSLGNDVEGYAAVTRYRCGRCGQLLEVLEHEDFNNACDACCAGDLIATGSSEVVRINLLPVRPDVFDVAGLARALRGWLGIETGLRLYEFPRSGLKVNVRRGLEKIRPHIVACAARAMALDDELVKVLMKMQENLHWALGRDRRRASIGVYDLDTVKPDFEYRPVEPEELRFVPLFGMPDGMVAATPQGILAKHPKGTGYAHLLAGFSQYPLLADAQAKVLSMPPIINSNETRVTEKTKNLFVDVTGPDHNAITKTLNIIAAALADLGARVETVEVVYSDGRRETTPDMSSASLELDPAEVNRVLGFKLSAREIARCLKRLRHGARAEDDKVMVEVPAYRSDVMHPWDLVEDVGIGYGYDRIKPRLVPSMTIARPQHIEETSETCRRAMTGLGFLETMTLLLTSPDEHLLKLGLLDDGRYATIENPASVEQTIVRRHLLSGLLATFRVNTTAEMPQQVFEIGDCFEPDPEAGPGVRSRRKVGIGIAGPKVGFADAKSVAAALGFELGIELDCEPSIHPAFILGRAARLVCGGGAEAGLLGEVHPEVLERFGISQPVCLVELDLSLAQQGG